MSLKERIEAQTKLDNDLMVQNERIGKSARPIFENIVLPFKTQDQELIKEYNAQFPTSFETVDPDTGKKTFRRYLMPQDEPELDEPDLEIIPPQSQVDRVTEVRKKASDEIRILGKTIIKINQLRGKAKEDMDSGKKRFSKQVLETYDQALQEGKDEISYWENGLSLSDNFLKAYALKKAENDRKISVAKQSNDFKIKQYQNELKILNNQAFNTEQLPSETEQDYLNRLTQNAEVDTVEEQLQNSIVLTLKRFKDSMKEIIRDNSLIEQVCNSLDPKQKLDILKVWAEVKRNFVKKFGEFNKNIVAYDIIQFLSFYTHINIFDTAPDIEEDWEFRRPNSAMEEFSSSSSAIEELDKIRKRDREKKDIRNATKRENRASIAEQLRNPAIAEPVEEGKGLGVLNKQLPKFVPFGKMLLGLHKLYYNNVLCVKWTTMKNVAGFSNAKVSEKFVRILMNLLEHISPTVNEIHSLSTGEKALFDRLIYISQLHKTVHHTTDKTVHNLKERMKLVEGELLAGNNNKVLYKELYAICHSLKDFGVLSGTAIKEYLAQFKRT